MKTLSTTMLKTKKFIYPLLLVLLLSFGAFLLFFQLPQRGIIAYDEARHGVNAYEMLQRDDWLVPTYMGEVDYWNLKPPLSQWAIMLGFKIFGYNNLGFRFQSAFATLVMLAVVALWTKKRHGSLASLISLCFLLANFVFYKTHSGRTSDADALFYLFATMGFLFMLDSRRNIRYLYGTALCFGIAFMAKSFHALFIPLACFLYLLLTGEIRKLTWKDYLLIPVLALLPIIPWAIARYQFDGARFFTSMIQTDVLARMTDEIEGKEGLWYYYFYRLATNPTVVVAGLLFAVGLGMKLSKVNRPTPEQTGLMLWMAVPVIVFSISSFKLHHYIFTSMTGMAVAAGWTVSFLWQGARRGLLLTLTLVCAAGLLVQQMVSNVQMIRSESDWGSYQEALVDMLDRDIDSGVTVYIQYNDSRSTWSQAHVLCAEMAGDVICKNGGVEAFEQEEEDALLVVDKACFDYTMLEYYPLYYESTYLIVLEN